MNRNRNLPSVLIVDDERVSLRLLSVILEKEGFIVFTATNAADCLRLARENSPDLILLDVLLPDEDGFSVCAKLKRNPLTGAIPIIFISALDDAQSRVAGLTGGGVDYINKPFEREEVLARVRIHLRIKQAFEALVLQQQAKLHQLREAQRAILPAPSDFPEAKFSIYFRSLHEAGGDFYDVIPLGDEICGYFAADVGGHDLGAAFVTSALKALLRQNFGPLYTPAETMRVLNGVLRPVLQEGRLLSACCVRLNRHTGSLAFVSAGHPPLILIRKNSEVQRLIAEGDLLGAFESPFFESREVVVTAGDRFFLFSDGLIEAYREKPVTREEGLERLSQNLAEFQKYPLAEATQNAALAVCSVEQTPQDDLLLLGVEV
jgi:sigma-B regulation protein RsbU (phosphoserine phosphatase)